MPPFIPFKHNCRNLQRINIDIPNVAPPRIDYLTSFRQQARGSLINHRLDPSRFAPAAALSEPGFAGCQDNRPRFNLQQPPVGKHDPGMVDASTMTDPIDVTYLINLIQGSSFPEGITSVAKEKTTQPNSLSLNTLAQTISSSTPFDTTDFSVVSTVILTPAIVATLDSDFAMIDPAATKNGSNKASTPLLAKNDTYNVFASKNLTGMDYFSIPPSDNSFFPRNPAWNGSSVDKVHSPRFSPECRKENTPQSTAVNTPATSPPIWRGVGSSCAGCSKRFTYSRDEGIYECIFPTCGLRACGDCARVLALHQEDGGVWGDVQALRKYVEAKKNGIDAGEMAKKAAKEANSRDDALKRRSEYFRAIYNAQKNQEVFGEKRNGEGRILFRGGG